MGIRPDPLPRIFNPFFTTKTGHWGTSLGPSLPREIVKKHGERSSWTRSQDSTPR